MAAVMPIPAASRVLMSGNEAVARAVWEAGVKVAAAYPGTPSTEMLEVISTYPDIYAEWSVNEKVSLEVAIGAAYAGSRSFCCMKHVGMNVASDALMTLTLTGVIGGLVIAIADDVGLGKTCRPGQPVERQGTAARERDRAIADIQAAKNAAVTEIAGRAADMAVLLAGRIVRRELNEQDHTAMIAEALEKFPSQN